MRLLTEQSIARYGLSLSFSSRCSLTVLLGASTKKPVLLPSPSMTGVVVEGGLSMIHQKWSCLNPRPKSPSCTCLGGGGVVPCHSGTAASAVGASRTIHWLNGVMSLCRTRATSTANLCAEPCGELPVPLTQCNIILTFQIPQYGSKVLPSGCKPSGIRYHISED